MYQDNISIVRLEINGILYSSKCTNNIKAIFFFIKDKVDTRQIEIEHFPNEIMWADVHNKTKGGRPFRLGGSYLMNVPVDYDNDVGILKTYPDLLPEADRILANS